MTLRVNLSEVFNYVQLTSEIATSGQPASGQFQHIAAASYETVINLAMADSTRALPDEGSRVAAQGMAYIHIPVPFDAPAIQHFHLFRAVMDHSQARQTKIWVHCAMNLRVSAFMYLYLHHVRGWPQEKARSPVFDHWQPDSVWQNFLDISGESLRAAS